VLSAQNNLHAGGRAVAVPAAAASEDYGFVASSYGGGGSSFSPTLSPGLSGVEQAEDVR
jgi:hypothetical protein